MNLGSARESRLRVDDRRGVTRHVHVSLLSRFDKTLPLGRHGLR